MPCTLGFHRSSSFQQCSSAWPSPVKQRASERASQHANWGGRTTTSGSGVCRGWALVHVELETCGPANGLRAGVSVVHVMEATRTLLARRLHISCRAIGRAAPRVCDDPCPGLAIYACAATCAFRTWRFLRSVRRRFGGLVFRERRLVRSVGGSAGCDRIVEASSMLMLNEATHETRRVPQSTLVSWYLSVSPALAGTVRPRHTTTLLAAAPSRGMGRAQWKHLRRSTKCRESLGMSRNSRAACGERRCLSKFRMSSSRVSPNSARISTTAE